MAELASDLPRYEATIRDKVGGLREGVLGRLSTRDASTSDARSSGRRRTIRPRPRTQTPAQAAPEPQQPLPVEVREPDLTPLELAQRFVAPILHPLAMLGIVFVVLIFILLQREDLRDRMIRLFGSSDLHRTTAAMDDAARRLSRYFLIQLGLNAAFGVWIGSGCGSSACRARCCGACSRRCCASCPISARSSRRCLPIVLAAAVDPGWSMVLWTAALFLVTEPVMGHVVEPLVYGQSTGLSPFAVVVSAIFWTWLWGPIGLLLATPLTLCLVVLGRHVERLEFLDVLLGDRPALTPAENFYQRMLAGDPDEALEHAEQLLKERSLSSYYDEVALKGLQLAANDAARGVLAPAQIEHIKEAIKGLVHDLGSVPDAEPPKAEERGRSRSAPPLAEKALPKEPPVEEPAPAPEELPESWRGEAPIMCIAGRGALDEAASTMLAQLLRKHGLGARVVPHEAVSRSNIIGLDYQGRRDGVRVLPRDQGQPGASALPPAAPAPEGRRRADPRRPVAGRGGGADG